MKRRSWAAVTMSLGILGATALTGQYVSPSPAQAASAVGSGALSYAEIEGFWIEAGGSAASAPTAAAIAQAESGSNPGAIQPRTSYCGSGSDKTGWGLFQITCGNSVPQFGIDFQMLDPLNNADAAVAKYNAAGHTFSGVWVTYPNPANQYLQSGVAPQFDTDPGQWTPRGSAPSGTHNSSQPGVTSGGSSAGPAGLAKYIYQLHSDGSVYERAEGPGSCSSTTVCTGWAQLDGVGSGDKYVAGSAAYAYALHSDGSVFERPQGGGACTSSSSCTGWTQIDGATGGDVALASSANYVYVLHNDGSVFERPQGNGSCSSTTACTGWTEVDGQGSGDIKVAASGSYVFALHSDGSIFERPEGSGSCSSPASCTGWSQVDGQRSGDIAVAASSSYVYALHQDGSVFERPHGTGVCSSPSSCTGWIQVDGVGSDSGIGGTNGYVYGLHKDGSVFERPQGNGSCSSTTTCTGWTQVDAVGNGRVMVS